MRTSSDRPYLKPPAGDLSPPRTTRPLAVLIVTYQSHELLEKCLAKVAEHLGELPVYVYENSGDDYPGRDELAARHPYVNWVLGPVNLGFASAFNALVEHTPPDTDLLMLNPDAQLLGPLTETRRLLLQPGVAAVAPLMIDESAPGPERWDIATRRRNLIRAVIAAAGYADRLRGTWFSYLYARQPGESDDIEGYVCGACTAINRDAWNTLGGFDEEFFLYGEETDWQHRARAAGWRVLLADELGILHGDDEAHDNVSVPARRGRGYDLLRGHIALLLEHQYSANQANVYLAATSVLDRLQRSRRRVRRLARPGTDLPHILITANQLMNGGVDRQKADLATELSQKGYPVTIVCLRRFGRLIKEVPHSVRVERQPWWAPMVDSAAGPTVLIGGDTVSEVKFAALWRITGRHRRWLVAAHMTPNEGGPTYARPLAAAMRRADGFVALSQKHWQLLSRANNLGHRRCTAPRGGDFTVAAMADAYEEAIECVL